MMDIVKSALLTDGAAISLRDCSINATTRWKDLQLHGNMRRINADDQLDGQYITDSLPFSSSPTFNVYGLHSFWSNLIFRKTNYNLVRNKFEWKDIFI